MPGGVEVVEEDQVEEEVVVVGIKDGEDPISMG